MIVGLTGGIATGKSTVTSMLRRLGAYVVDADVWARRVVEVGSDGLREIAGVFGEAVLLPDGSLNRPALGKIVFGDASARDKLNEITHPRVRQGMKDETLAYFENHRGRPIVWDVPLLFEGETLKLVDTTVLVYVPESVQLERLMSRDKLSQSDALARMRAQMPIDDKRKLAEYVIDNSRDEQDTEGQVMSLWRELNEKAATRQAGSP